MDIKSGSSDLEEKNQRKSESSIMPESFNEPPEATSVIQVIY